MDEAALDAFAEAVCRIHDPAWRLAVAVSAIFAEAPARERAATARQLEGADLVMRHREWQARSEARYGPREAMMARMEARGGAGLSARVWC